MLLPPSTFQGPLPSALQQYYNNQDRLLHVELEHFHFLDCHSPTPLPFRLTIVLQNQLKAGEKTPMLRKKTRYDGKTKPKTSAIQYYSDGLPSSSIHELSLNLNKIHLIGISILPIKKRIGPQDPTTSMPKMTKHKNSKKIRITMQIA